MNKEGSFKPVVIVLLISLVIAGFWDNIPIFKDTAHKILDPSIGALLNWNLAGGMFIIVFIITLITTILQKYTTDQKTLKELKAEQKKIQKEMRELKDHPEKMMELQKSMMPLTGQMMKLSMRPIAFTGVPFLLLFRWFHDFFQELGDPKVFWIMGWLSFYFVASIIISSFLRKWMDVA